MPTLKELREELIREDSGAIFTDESKLDFNFIDSQIHEYRAEAIALLFRRYNGRINPVWTQQFVLKFNKDLQEDDCKVLFECPAPITLNSTTDGFLYVGTIDGNCNYRKVSSRHQIALMNTHKSTKNFKGARVLYSDGYLEVYNNTLIEEVKIDGIFENPESVKTFNTDFDQYPICSEGILLLKDMFFKRAGLMFNQKPADRKSDSADSTSTQLVD